MTLTMACLLVTIGVFGLICLRLSAKLHDANVRIEILEVKATYSEQSEKTLRESVDLQTKCIRDLNDIVKKSVEGKEPTKPDTKALLSGWNTDEPELVQQLISKEELMQQLIKENLNYQRIEPLPQQCIYPWQPWQTGQLQLCATHPLWYINRGFEDME